ncbi:MAG: biopolymer transporter ExbD [Chitinivibrionales bacterium]|nr:biopolymer transporter ExbD [Chitinivibrionales bacterium]
MAKQRGRGKKTNKKAGLQITSMMDMFTILVVFLLKQFAAEGAILTNADNLVLPNSVSKKRPKEVNLQLAVTNDMILVDNVPTVPTEDVKNIPLDNPVPVEPKLEEALKGHYASEEEMVRLGALNQVEGKVIIQVDKNIEFDILYKVMTTCGKVGYNKMNFAVMERES